MNKAIKVIDDMLEEQLVKYQECKDGRTTRMKNNDFKNWGMVDAENKVKHYKEVKERIMESEGK